MGKHLGMFRNRVEHSGAAMTVSPVTAATRPDACNRLGLCVTMA